MVKERNLAVSIILTIVTCGIYGIVWYISMTDDVGTVSGDQNMSGGKAFLFTLLTCGIYSFIWSYNVGKDLNEAQLKAGKPATDNSILYLILSLFGLGIVVYALVQNELNKFASTPTNNVQGA